MTNTKQTPADLLTNLAIHAIIIFTIITMMQSCSPAYLNADGVKVRRMGNYEYFGGNAYHNKRKADRKAAQQKQHNLINPTVIK